MFTFIRKLFVFWRSFFWLKRNLKYFFLLLFPFLIGLVFFILSWTFFLNYEDKIITWLFSESWLDSFGKISFYFLKILLYGLVMVVSLPIYLLVVNVVSSPIFDYVSLAVEKKYLKSSSRLREFSFLESLALIKEELKKVVFILVIHLLLLFLPGGVLLSPLLSAFCLGWDYYDFPLARRGWTFRQRLSFVLKNLSSIFGLGLWLLIPGVAFFFFPLAVIGGTILALEDLSSSNNL